MEDSGTSDQASKQQINLSRVQTRQNDRALSYSMQRRFALGTLALADMLLPCADNRTSSRVRRVMFLCESLIVP